jgi:hypothetical protein
MSMTPLSPRGNQRRLPKPKPLITIDCFTIQKEKIEDLVYEWNYLISEISWVDNVNSINLYQNFHQRDTWILQIEWKSGQELNQALSHPDFQEFQDFLNKWNIAISPEQQKYVSQIYRKFPGINFYQARSNPKFSWIISTDFIIIIAFVFGIAAALIILILR